MNQILNQAILEVSALPESDQHEIALQILDLAARKRIDTQLLAAEKRGGSTPSSVLFEELKARYAG